MRLYVEPMDCFVLDVTPDGSVQIEGEEPRPPTLQERRAIIYAAQKELAALAELVEILERRAADGGR
jgi:hypothetical protein